LLVATSRANTPHSVLTNVLAQNVLNLLLVETTTEDKTLGTVHGSLGTQLGIQEHEDVLGLTVETTANVDKVGKRSLLGTLTGNLGRNNGVPALLAGKLGVVEVEEGEEPLQQLVVGRFTVLGDPGVDTASLGSALNIATSLEQVVVTSSFKVVRAAVKLVEL
jgi:hypothetical protein